MAIFLCINIFYPLPPLNQTSPSYDPEENVWGVEMDSQNTDTAGTDALLSSEIN